LRDDAGVTEMKKRSVVLLILLIGFAIVTTTYAFNVTTVSDAVEFVSSPRNSLNRAITNYQTYPLGEDSVYVTFTVATGTDVIVRVMPLKSDNSVIITPDGLGEIQENTGTGWGLFATDFGIDEELVWTSSTTAGGTFYLTFDEVDINISFVTFMIEVIEN